MKTLNKEDLKIIFPKVPDEFLPEKLATYGKAKFKGDKMPDGWSVNDKFIKGIEYPVYYYNDGEFVVGNDGKGYKILKSAWTKIKSI